MKKLTVVKVGGEIVEEADTLDQLLRDFSTIEGAKILVHGGGRSATNLASQLGIKSRMVNGRRITSAAMLKVATMVYGGWVNKRIVAGLQARKVNALGLTGADAGVIRSVKRAVEEIDYGYVGDVQHVNSAFLSGLLEQNIVPVLAPLTYDEQGHLLNTNADTIAGEVAKALSDAYRVTLVYCFEKPGVLRNEDDENSLLSCMNRKERDELIAAGVIRGGMIPKLENSFSALDAGVDKVIITSASLICTEGGTLIQK